MNTKDRLREILPTSQSSSSLSMQAVVSVPALTASSSTPDLQTLHPSSSMQRLKRGVKAALSTGGLDVVGIAFILYGLLWTIIHTMSAFVVVFQVEKMLS